MTGTEPYEGIENAAVGAARHGLIQSKKSGGLWWKKVDNEDEAEELRGKIGPAAWIAPLSQLKEKSRPQHPQYPPTPPAVLAKRDAERQRALSDFETGVDWPPWEEGP